METITISYTINQPSIEDYNSAYLRMPCNTGNKENLFNIICSPENINGALLFAESTGSSPVSLYEKKIQSALDAGSINRLDWHEKQFVGSVTCFVMESNGWKKTGKKQRFSKSLFKSAEIYTKNLA